VGLASQVAYSALFSLFPFLLFVRAIVAYFPGLDRLGTWFLEALGEVITTDSRLFQIVEENVFAELSAEHAGLLSVGIVLTLWGASGAVMTLINAVNRAYGLKETRSWQRRRLMAAGLAMVGAILFPSGILLLVFGSWAGDRIGQAAEPDSFVHSLWVAARWPGAFLFLVAAMALFFYLAPCVRQKWYSTMPGALFAVGAIMGISVGLSWFLSQSIFRVRWLTYGAIGTVIVLLFWAFLGGFMMLVGAEINAAVRRVVEKKDEPSVC